MKRFKLLFPGLAAFVLTSCATLSEPKKLSIIEPVENDSMRLHFPLTEHHLGNGLTVLIAPDPEIPVLSFQTWVKVGSVDESRPHTGIAHFFEHLMFKGTTRFPGRAFFQELETRGAQINAETSRDYTVFTCLSAPQFFEKVVEMEADRLVNLVIDDQTWMTERAVIFEEMKMRVGNSPEGKMSEALWRLVFSNHPYGTPVLGFVEDLATIEKKDLLEFYKKYYQPSNVTLVLTGRVNEAEALSLIGKYYGSIPGGPVTERAVSNHLSFSGEKRFALTDAVAKPRLLLGYRITPAPHDDTPSLDVLANILFQGQDSRFYSKLVLEKQTFSAISGNSYTPGHGGIFTISGVLKGSTGVKEAEASVEEEIKNIQAHGVTQEEVTQAVNQLVVMTLDNARSPEGLGEILGLSHLILGNAERFSEDFARYFKVKPEDIQRVARVYLQPNNRNVVVLMPEESKEKSE